MEGATVTLSQQSMPRRRRVYSLAVICLAGPLFFLCFYALSLSPIQGRFGLILIAILSGMMGIGGGWLVLRSWERHMRRAVMKLVEIKCGQVHQAESVNEEIEKMRLGYEHQIDLLHSSVAKSKEHVSELNIEMDRKLEQMRVAYLEFEDLRKEYTALEEEYTRYQSDMHSQLSHKDSLLEDYQRTIGEQREVIEKKQHYIGKLEGKVRDLMYEIRSLLQLEDPMTSESTYQPSAEKGKPYDFSLQLSRYLETAETFTGADHLGGRFLKSGASRYALDSRPLFDKLSHEGQGIVFVYSPTENRFLFVSDPIREKIGWGADKFVKDFKGLVVKGGNAWNDAIGAMEVGKQAVLPLGFRHKNGGEVGVDCYMGLISKGPFSGAIIGMLV